MPDGKDCALPSYPRVIQGLFVQKGALSRHLKTPYLAEREAYLGSLLASDHKRRYVYERAILLCQVIRIMDPYDLKEVREFDISEGATRWANERVSHSTNGRSRRCECFQVAARSWFKFLGKYIPPSRLSHQYQIRYVEFLAAMRNELGYLPASVQAAAVATKGFLEWVSLLQKDLPAISLTDVDTFISEGRAKGWGTRTVKSKCEALRVFFRYAERRGWSQRNLSNTIKAPYAMVRPVKLRHPPWKDIRRLIETLNDSVPSECRAKAILLLASIYGMRSCEIANLTLEDLDWYNEVLTIRRAKRGRVQQFPIQYEVGQAVIHYLQNVRPSSRFRNVFLTLIGPPRPVKYLAQSMWRLLRGGVFFDSHYGLHSLRRACATELLRQGTSLRAIADFLGHRGIRSVSLYAHCDSCSVREVADFSLGEVI